MEHIETIIEKVETTAKGAEFDCVSRSFAPKLAVPEDPVRGSDIVRLQITGQMY